ncbi:MAG: Omp28-related outer membrane protein [Chitinophagaceae bacterium]|nr:Omp28-related outer membrane protein [Chitinophagaceae bacterium]
MKRILLLCASVMMIQSVQAQVARTVLIEEFTGTWCGYCPDGHLKLKAIEDANPGRVISVGMHNADQFTIPYETAMENALGVAGFPRAAVDRFTYPGGNAFVMSRSYWQGAFAARLNVSSPVEINITPSYNSGSRLLNVTVNYTFKSAVTDETRITCLLVEDSLSSSQANYDNTTTGSPLYGLGNPIPDYKQKNVAVYLLSADSWGDANHPASVTANSSYSKSYSYTLPSTMNANQIKIVAFINKKIGASPVVSTGTEILNAQYTDINTSTAVNDIPKNITHQACHPNPFADITALDFNLAKDGIVKAYITDIYGRVVNELCNEYRVAGSHSLFWGGTTAQFGAVNNGIYLFHVLAGNEHIVEKVSLQR